MRSSAKVASRRIDSCSGQARSIAVRGVARVDCLWRFWQSLRKSVNAHYKQALHPSTHNASPWRLFA